GFNGPLQIVARVDAPGDQEALGRVAQAVAADPDVAAVTPPTVITGPKGQKVGVLIAYPKSAPQDAATTDLISRLRGTTIPKAVAGSQLTVLVGGITAIFTDFSHVLTSKLWLFIGVVVLLSFVLLAVVFRSLLVPAKAAVMNLL